MPYRSTLSSRRRRALPVVVGAVCLLVGVVIGYAVSKPRIRELESRVADLSQEAKALRQKQQFLLGGTAKDSNRNWITDELDKAANNLKQVLRIAHNCRC